MDQTTFVYRGLNLDVYPCTAALIILDECGYRGTYDEKGDFFFPLFKDGAGERNTRDMLESAGIDIKEQWEW